MKIRTNAGDVELTAEMVCRGMVFTAAEAERVKKVAASKAERAAALVVKQRKEEIELATRDKEAAERRLAQLRAER